jgi:hypothetical protein
MPLADILSLGGLPLSLILVQDRVLQLRLVSKKIMTALQSDFFMDIKICINDVGVENLTADFLQRWRGKMHLKCTSPWTPDSRWFKDVRDALLAARLRPLSLLSLSVSGKNLYPLAETLVQLGTSIQQLEIACLGSGSDFLAAATPIASLGPALTMKISVEDNDPGGSQTSLWLKHLVASSIRIDSISFRSVRWNTLANSCNAATCSHPVVRLAGPTQTLPHRRPPFPGHLCL